MKSKANWVVMGGKNGELGHCTRCGEGLPSTLPLPIYLAAALMEAFVKHHSRCKPGTFHEPPAVTPKQWLEGRDTGISSLTIFSIMTGHPQGRYDIPYDPSDFGRCYRLLKLFPAWRPRLQEVGERFAAWKPFLAKWDEMTALYEEELPNGTAPKLYALMQTLR